MDMGLSMNRGLGPDRAAETMARLEATARVHMLEPGQMVGFAERSAAFSRSMGFAPGGAWGAASTAAGYYANAVMAGQPFVSEPILRETMIRRVTGAQQSDLARAISGAASELNTPAARTSFIEQVQARGAQGGLTLAGVASLANAAGVSGSGIDMLNRGYTNEAEAIRASGQVNLAVMGANLGQLQETRRQTLRALGYDTSRLGGDDVSLEDMQGKLGYQGKWGIDNVRMGELSRYFDRQARTFGYAGGRRELDATLMANQKMVMEQHVIDTQTVVSRGFAAVGRNRGLMGLISFITQARENPSERNMTKLWSAIAPGNVKWSDPAVVDAMLGAKGENGTRTGGTLANLANAGETDRELALGTDVLMGALGNQTMGDTVLGADKMAELQALLTGADDPANRDKIRALGQYGSRAQKRAYNIFATALDTGIHPNTGAKLSPAQILKIQGQMKFLKMKIAPNPVPAGR